MSNGSRPNEALSEEIHVVDDADVKNPSPAVKKINTEVANREKYIRTARMMLQVEKWMLEGKSPRELYYLIKTKYNKSNETAARMISAVKEMWQNNESFLDTEKLKAEMLARYEYLYAHCVKRNSTAIAIKCLEKICELTGLTTNDININVNDNRPAIVNSIDGLIKATILNSPDIIDVSEETDIEDDNNE